MAVVSNDELSDPLAVEDPAWAHAPTTPPTPPVVPHHSPFPALLHSSLLTMAKHVRRAMLPGNHEVFTRSLAEGTRPCRDVWRFSMHDVVIMAIDIIIHIP